MFVSRDARTRYTESQAREAIASLRSFAEALRHLGMRPAGGNGATLRRRALRWGISFDHFDPHAARAAMNRVRGRQRRRPLAEILVQDSTYSRSALKARLFEEGLKERVCEECGQGEEWRGRRMSLILDHVNGIGTDNRLENLRIVCPNCAATLDTHCGRNKLRKFADRECPQCGAVYRPYGQEQKYCSVKCSADGRRGIAQSSGLRGIAQPSARRVERPPEPRLLAEIAELGYRAVGRRYGVSDNAIRKWVRRYEREREAADVAPASSGAADVGELPHAA